MSATPLAAILIGYLVVLFLVAAVAERFGRRLVTPRLTTLTYVLAVSVYSCASLAMPAGAADSFILALPRAADAPTVAVAVFLVGFSATTAMIVVRLARLVEHDLE